MQRLISALFTLVLLVNISIATAQERIEKTFSNIENIKLTTASGNGTIKRASGNEVKVFVEFTYDEDDYKAEFEQRGSTLEIKEEFRRSRWTRGRSEWTLEIPDGLDVEFKTGSGNIQIDGLEININASSGSGNIQLEGLNGEFRSNTGSGNLSFTDLEGSLSANTGSGSIRIENLEGNAGLNTGSGNIRLRNASGEFSMNTGSGNIEASEMTITGSSDLNTGSGNALLVLAAELNHDVDLSTGSGDAVLDFNGQEIAGKFIMKASDKDDIRAPFRFDKEYGDDDDDDNRGRSRWNRRSYTKEAKVGNKNIQIRIGSGSGRAIVRE